MINNIKKEQTKWLYRIIQVFSLSLVVALAGCGTQVRVPTSDSTPPQIYLYTYNYEGHGTIEITTDTTLHVPRNADIVVTAVGMDTEGLMGVNLYKTGSNVCGRGEVVARSPLDSFGRSDFEDPRVGVGDETLTSRVVTISVRGAYLYNCPPDTSLVKASMVFIADAHNFYGGRADSPVLTLIAP